MRLFPVRCSLDRGAVVREPLSRRLAAAIACSTTTTVGIQPVYHPTIEFSICFGHGKPARGQKVGINDFAQRMDHHFGDEFRMDLAEISRFDSRRYDRLEFRHALPLVIS